MRKVMLLAAMLAMVLAAAAPALAQVTGGDAEDGDATAAQYVDCSQVQAALGVQYGDDNAAVDDSVAGAADELGITQNQVNACLGNVTDVNQAGGNAGDIVVDENGTVVAHDDGSASASASASAAGSASAASEGSAAAAATTTLPETGGASLLALGAGALLVAGGLLARRIVR
jgi:hypothetical protein